MDEEPLPSSSHATTLPDSPLFEPRLHALKSSSPPPLFSENDSLDAADVTNYESPREKRKRAGTWWQIGPRAAPKRRQFNRNFDSGVYMMSDDSDVSAPASSLPSQFGFDATSDIPSDPPAPEHSEFRDEGFERATQSMSSSEARLCREIQQSLESNKTHYAFTDFEISDNELHHFGMLNQIVTVPPDVSVEVPAEGQYRSMIPEIHLNLSFNKLHRLSPTLFNLQHLTGLTLRNNRIEAIPPQIKNLVNLRSLDLCYNSIRTLPCELLALCTPNGNLTRLELAGNPLCDVSLSPGCYFYVAKSIREALSPAHRDLPLAQRISVLARTHPTSDQLPPNLIAGFLGWWEAADRARKNLVEQHHLYVPRETSIMVSRTTASYYDNSGRLLKNCPALPMREKVDCNYNAYRTQPGLLIPTSLGTHGVPNVWFDRPSSSKVPSLFTLSLLKAYKTEPESVRQEVCYYVGGSDEIPIETETVLLKAEQNVTSIFKPLRNCHCCDKDYIVPRAEWIEGWHYKGQVIPIKVSVCSWACVPDIIAKRPEPLRWMDVPGSIVDER